MMETAVREKETPAQKLDRVNKHRDRMLQDTEIQTDRDRRIPCRYVCKNSKHPMTGKWRKTYEEADKDRHAHAGVKYFASED